MTKPRYFLGLNLEMDPAVALVCDGRVVAYAEEERFLRIKHAPGHYPLQALRFCLAQAGIGLAEVEAMGVNFDLSEHGPGGRVTDHYHWMRQHLPLDPGTVAWQERNLAEREVTASTNFHYRAWRRGFGAGVFPPLVFYSHHLVHAFQAFMQSRFEQAVCLTVDGSGDEQCSVIWQCDRKQGPRILRAFNMPDSLGWYYAAFTEYLGFRAYDGEYKVMGLAAYGAPDPELTARVGQVLALTGDGGYRVDGRYIHYGAHTWSGRFTDQLAVLLGRPPRLPHEPLEAWHRNLALAVQTGLEQAMEAMVAWAVAKTGLKQVCIGGGVGLNVKANSRIFNMPQVEDVFAHPLCGDAGAACGSALLACHRFTGALPEPLVSLALGPVTSEEELGQILVATGQPFERPADLCAAVAEALAAGKVVGWFQGAMEAGPRALGQRSILADPRTVAARDKVNQVIKYREMWRPFCPSMVEEAASRYLVRWTFAPFMVIAFAATEALRAEAPAIVHVDGTVRVQLVSREIHPLYHALLRAFATRTGVPVLLNTSFNVKGEPIVCSALDAIRTFWSTGMDLLAIGPFLVRKPVQPGVMEENRDGAGL